MRVVSLSPLLFGLLVVTRAPPPASQDTEPHTIAVRQAGEADVLGADDVALQAGLERLRASGGTLVLGPGRYVVRRAVFPPAGVTVRGEEGAILALPAPALLAAAKAGAQSIVVEGAHEFTGDTRVQLLPPAGSEHFPDGLTKSLELQRVERVAGQELVLADALPFDVPAGSRVGYPHKLFWVNKAGLTTFEDLVFEGGRTDAIAMPGHSQRCAIWAAAPFGFGEERLADPGRGVTVRRCRFTDWYGRGVAFYNQVDGVVEDCVFERIHDEAIDLDHFVERFRVSRNEVRDALWGIVLNDASRNLIEANRIEGCDIGIWSWWYENTPRRGINEENVIRGNVIKGARQHAILIDKTCVRYVIEGNQVQGSIHVVEQENSVGPNEQL